LTGARGGLGSSTGNVLLNDVTFSGNKEGSDGAIGAANSGGNWTLNNVLITGNQAGFVGCGIHDRQSKRPEAWPREVRKVTGPAASSVRLRADGSSVPGTYTSKVVPPPDFESSSVCAPAAGPFCPSGKPVHRSACCLPARTARPVW